MSRRPLTLLMLALACAIGALAVWLAAFALPAGQRLDGAALAAFGVVAQPRLEPSIRGVADLANPLALIVIASALVGIALSRRRWLMAALVPVILLAANGFTQLAKPGLAHPRIVELSGIDGAYPASWPSGHATVAMSLALCAVLVAGSRLRPFAAVLGSAYAIAVGYSLVALGFHLPSDVLGGFLVAATFALLGAAALAHLEKLRPQETAEAPAHSPARTSALPRALVLAAVTTLTTLVLCGLAVLASHPSAAESVSANTAAVLVAVCIAAPVVALIATLTLTLRSDR